MKWDESKLLLHGTLMCVRWCRDLAVVCAHTLCVGDAEGKCFAVVDVKEDKITATLDKPHFVREKSPHNVAVLGNAILTAYKNYGDEFPILVLYENGVSSPGTRIPCPEGLQSLSAISSNSVLSRFLMLDGKRHVVYVLDVDGSLCHTVEVDTDEWLNHSTVGDGEQAKKLFVGCSRADRIIIMSP